MIAVLWGGPCDGQELQLGDPLPDHLSVPLLTQEEVQEGPGQMPQIRTMTTHHIYHRSNLMRHGRIFYRIGRDDVQ
jgi:hypothetical protein